MKDKDIYDRAVARAIELNLSDEQLYELWNEADIGPQVHGISPDDVELIAELFKSGTSDGDPFEAPSSGRFLYCGCITQVAHHQYSYPSQWEEEDQLDMPGWVELEEELNTLANEGAIPDPGSDEDSITLDHLPLFAEYQRRFKALRGQEVPG